MSTARSLATLERIAGAQAEAAPHLAGGALWAARRHTALERLLEHGLPGRRDENWRHFDLRAVDKRDFRRVAAPALDAGMLGRALDALPGACRLVLVNGRYSATLSSASLPAGVSATPLHEALARDPGGAAGRLAPPGEGTDERYALVAEAFAGEGLLLEFAPGAEVIAPVEVVHVAASDSPGAMHTRLLIDAGPGSRAAVVERFISVGAAELFVNLHAEVAVAEGAALAYYRVQQLGGTTTLVETLSTRIARDGHYAQHGFPLGAAVARTSQRVVLAGEGAEAILDGLFLADGTRQVDLYALLEHAAPRTRSEQVFRGVATDTGHGAFNGKVIVHAGAQKSDSSQSSRNLILSPAAEIDVRPQLEIHADDVKCSHGATVGSLDPNQLFYLLSRGLDRRTAQGLLTFAFCEDVLRRVRLPELRRALEAAVVGRLPDREVILEFV